MIKSENHLQKNFLIALKNNKSPWGELKFREEFNFNGGRTDIIALDSSSIVYAFEIKLEKWKVALNQAYRNTNFANKSYVILPREIAERAVKHKYQFERRSVGLCYLEGNKIIQLLDCDHSIPTLPWLNNKAKDVVEQIDEDFR